MDINSLLQNDTLKGLMLKAGIKPEQVNGILNAGLTTIKDKFASQPEKVSSLLSDNPNTNEDNAMAGALDNDFIGNIAKKFGLPDSVTSKLKGSAMPAIIQQFSGSLNTAGSNNQGGISGMLAGLMDMIDGDGKKNGGAGMMGMLSGLFSKLFGKK